MIITLDPPVTDAARSAHITLLRKQHQLTRTKIQFPSDVICVSALQNPFTPIDPVRATAGSGKSVPVKFGWEPEFLLIPHPWTMVVRMADGLLILLSEPNKKEWDRSYFVAIPPSVALAGIKIASFSLSILLQGEFAGRETIHYRRYRLSADGSAHSATSYHHHVPARQLFDWRSQYALPPMIEGDDNGAVFCSTTGQPYQLSKDQDRTIAFKPCYNMPVTLHSNGRHIIYKNSKKGRHLHASLAKSVIDSYNIFEPARDIRRIVYSVPDRSLAYSVRSAHWIVPHSQPSDHIKEPPEIHLGGHETLLSAKNLKEGVRAWIWSDARYGGNGSVFDIVFGRDGDRGRGRNKITLGNDALAIAHIQSVEGVLWGVVVDAQHRPTELLEFRRRGSRMYQRTRHDLEALRTAACPIGLELGHG